MSRPFFRIARGLIKAGGFLSVYFCLLPMLILTVSDVFLRYAVGSPFFWSNEICTYLMVVGAFLAFGITFTENRHVRVELFFDALPRKVQNVWWVVISIVFALYIAFMAYAVFVLAVFSFKRRTITPTSEIVFFPMHFAVAVGLVILLVAVILFVVKRASIAAGVRPESERGGVLVELEKGKQEEPKPQDNV